MNKPIIEVKNLSKLYRLGTIGSTTLYESINRWWYKMRGKEEMLNKIGAGHRMVEPDDPQAGPEPNTMWALKDVSFTVNKGEIVGIIGKNGAGKSTLLKLLTRITEPTSGEAIMRGRVASLLEVGTGFHGELTGRENIYLNGAILGMKKKEIDNKFDEIVEFSGVEKFIDTPVKRYSSGMYVRLAFAVAAHLEPEILLVDEVLAVGDVEFQKKCLGKMKDVAAGGRTVLFVSHNMSAIRNLCDRTLLVDCGTLILDANTPKVVSQYLDRNLSKEANIYAEAFEKNIEGVINRNNPSIRLKEIALFNQNGLLGNTFHSGESIRISITYQCLTVVNDLRVIIQIVDEDNRPILTTLNCDDVEELVYHRRKPGIYTSSCTILPNTFGEQRFYVSVQLIYPKTEHLVLNKILKFDVKFNGYNNVQYGSWKASFLRPLLKWKTEVLKEKLKDGS